MQQLEYQQYAVLDTIGMNPSHINNKNAGSTADE